MRRREPHLAALAALLSAEAAAVHLLHRLGNLDGLGVGWSDLPGWIRNAPPEDALLATLRLVALVGAWWLLCSTVLYTAARLVHRPAAARAIGWAALPFARRIVDGALAVSITASAMVGVGAARTGAAPPPSTTSPPVVISLDHRDHVSTQSTTARDGRELTSIPAPLPRPAPSVPAPPASPQPPLPARQHTVTPGDNLWTIATVHLATVNQRDPGTLGDTEIASYWSRVVDENRGRLQSGDPNLIFPGEVVELPPVI